MIKSKKRVRFFKNLFVELWAPVLYLLISNLSLIIVSTRSGSPKWDGSGIWSWIICCMFIIVLVVVYAFSHNRRRFMILAALASSLVCIFFTMKVCGILDFARAKMIGAFIVAIFSFYFFIRYYENIYPGADEKLKLMHARYLQYFNSFIWLVIFIGINYVLRDRPDISGPKDFPISDWLIQFMWVLFFSVGLIWYAFHMKLVEITNGVRSFYQGGEFWLDSI